MLPLPSTLEDVARRLFWWKTPAEALGDSNRFLAQVMTLGTIEDLRVARRHFGDDDFRAVLGEAPPGVFDARSWAYWHQVLGLGEAPALPRRHLPPGLALGLRE